MQNNCLQLVEATPSGAGLEEMFGFTTNGRNFPGLTALVFRSKSTIAGFAINGQFSLSTIVFPNLEKVPPGALLSFQTNPVLTAISFPVLTNAASLLTISTNVGLSAVFLPVLATAAAITMAGNFALPSLSIPSLTVVSGNFSLTSATALTSLSLPLLATVAGALTVTSTLLASVSLPALVTVGLAISLANNSVLTDVSLPLYLPTNGQNVTFAGCALTQSSVDHILARCVANSGYVSGVVNLSGGTNASPGTQGALDKATLQARGCTVTTN